MIDVDVVGVASSVLDRTLTVQYLEMLRSIHTKVLDLQRKAIIIPPVSQHCYGRIRQALVLMHHIMWLRESKSWSLANYGRCARCWYEVQAGRDVLWLRLVHAD